VGGEGSSLVELVGFRVMQVLNEELPDKEDLW